MKVVAFLVLSVFILFFGIQIYEFWSRERVLDREFQTLEANLEAAHTDNQKLQAELQYLTQPANLEKELRQRFNYRDPAEKLIIIVPRTTSTASSTP